MGNEGWRGSDVIVAVWVILNGFLAGGCAPFGPWGTLRCLPTPALPGGAGGLEVPALPCRLVSALNRLPSGGRGSSFGVRAAALRRFDAFDGAGIFRAERG